MATSVRLRVPASDPGIVRTTSAGAKIRTRCCGKQDASALAQLHIEHLSSRLGIRVMEVYYQALLESQGGFCVCAESDGNIVAYVGVVSDRIRLLRSILRRQAVTLSACVLAHPRVVPQLLSHLWTWLVTPVRAPQHAQTPRWEYRPVVVSRAYRNQGVAKILFDAAERVLLDHGITEIFLLVQRTNAAAMRAYARSGFSPVGKERSTTVLMLKELAEASSFTPSKRQVPSQVHNQ